MGKKLRDEDLNLNIIVNGDKSKKELGDLEKSTRELTTRNKELRAEKEKLIRAGKQESEEYKAVTKEITENNRVLKTNETRMTELRKEIGLTGLTMRQLRSEQTRLKRLMDSSTPRTEQWKLYRAELDKIESQMGKVRNGGERMKMSLGKMADGFNRYFAMVSVWVASLTGVVLGFKKASAAFAEFDDQVADVQKTTQLSKEEVLEIDKALQQIDTRTSQEELLGLARIAGKLGVDTKEGVEEFVRGADKVAVALTEDLGGNIEESVNDLGKLIDIFKLKDDFGLEASFMKVGSAINDLGASGTANEGYIVEFTKRVAGIAPSAGISIEKVMGLAATLDQLGQTSEVASTVYSQVIPDMFKDTATYAGIANMSVADFTNLLNTDSNAAFIRFLEGLNGNNGGLAEMTAKLDGLGLEGKRSISVLGVLANNTETLREQQDLSAKSFENGSSLIAEFNIKNETMQARLDKSRKELGLITRELGEKLSPAMLVSTNGITYFIKGTVAGIRVFNEYKGTILGAAAGIAAYTIAVKVAASWDTIHYGYLVTKTAITRAYGWVVTLLTGQVTLATAAQNAWNIAQKANPIGLVIGLLTAAATAYFVFKGKVKEATVEQKKFNDEMERGKELMGQTKTLEERGRVMATMNKRQLEEFKANLEDQIKAEEDFHSKLLTEAKKALDGDAKLQELYNNRKATGLSEMQKININALIGYRKRELTRELQDQDNASQKRLKQLKKYMTEADALMKGNKGGGGGGLDEDAQKKASDKALEILDQASNQRMAALVKQYEREAWTDERWKMEQMAAELAYLEQKKALLEQFGQSTIDVERQINQQRAAINKEVLSEELKELYASLEADQDGVNKAIDSTIAAADKTVAELDRLKDKEAQILEQRKEAYLQFSLMLGESFGQLMSDSEATFADYLQNTLVMALEAFHQFFLIEKAKAIIKGAAEGPIGMAIAVAKVVGMELAYQGAKAAVLSIGKKKSKAKGYAAGGYTGDGAWNEPAGIVHKKEWVGNRYATGNPDVKQFLDVFDYYQRTGQISKLNTKMILANLPVQQMYAGGYSSQSGSSSSGSPSSAPGLPSSISQSIPPEDLRKFTEAINRLMEWDPGFSIEYFERKKEMYDRIVNGGLG